MLALTYLVLSFILSFPYVLALDHINYAAETRTATYAIASQLGIFEQWNLNVTFFPITDLVSAYPTWARGGYDILSGTIDDALDYRFNANISVSVIGQLDGGPDLVIAAVPGITSVAQLRGQSLLIDSAFSGHAYALRKVLSWHGLWIENGDYSLEVVNSTAEAYHSLIAGVTPNGTQAAAAVLAYPYTAAGQAASPPLNTLIRVADYINPLASTVFAISQPRLNQNATRDIDIRFLAAMMTANDYLSNPANAATAVHALSEQLGVSQRIAEAQYNAATSSDTGETITQGTFAVNRHGLLNVMDVRGQFSGFNPALSHFDFASAIMPGPGQFIDDSVRIAAMQLMNRR